MLILLQGGRRSFRSSRYAQNAIERIKGEGEGAPGNPEQPGRPGQLAHFYLFKEILIGNNLAFDQKSGKLIAVPGKTIRFPTVFPFEISMATPNPSTAFNKLLTQLLTDLEACWTKGSSLGKAIGDMIELAEEGKTLIKRGIRPDFVWVALG
jgi:hypothetical protein